MLLNIKKWKQALFFVAVLWMFPLSGIGNEGRQGNVCETAEQKKEEREILSDDGKMEPSPMIALTFDDGPNSQYTPKLLDGLKERGVRATFFVIGANIEKEGGGDILRRMQKEGHMIGNHTFHHVELSKLNPADAEKEILMTDRLIREATGKTTGFVRPPFGDFPNAEELSDKLYVKWTVDSKDWLMKNTEQIIEKVVTEAGENDIILMHDCYETSVEAALGIIDILQEKGFDFVTLDRIIIE